MSLLLWILIFSLFGGALSVIAAGGYLLLPEGVRNRTLPHFVSFAIGALLGAAFLAILPHALESPEVADPHRISLTVLLGLLGFFLLEKMVLWRHCHGGVGDMDAHDFEPHGRSAGVLILVGDAIHNTVDGVLIAAAFLTDFHLGVVTSLAVAAHEIPQEVGDFAILLHSGFSTARAFIFNMLSTLTTVVGALLSYYSFARLNSLLPYVLAVAASSFIYIAVADLIPGLHKRVNAAATLQQVVLIAAGVVVIYAVHTTLH